MHRSDRPQSQPAFILGDAPEIGKARLWRADHRAGGEERQRIVCRIYELNGSI